MKTIEYMIGYEKGKKEGFISAIDLCVNELDHSFLECRCNARCPNCWNLSKRIESLLPRETP